MSITPSIMCLSPDHYFSGQAQAGVHITVRCTLPIRNHCILSLPRRTTHKPFIAAPDTRRQACDLARHAQQSSLVSIADSDAHTDLAGAGASGMGGIGKGR